MLPSEIIKANSNKMFNDEIKKYQINRWPLTNQQKREWQLHYTQVAIIHYLDNQSKNLNLITKNISGWKQLFKRVK